MFSGLEILFIIICCLFIFLVMIQKSSSGNMAGLESNGNNVHRVSGLTKICAVLASLFLIISFTLNYNHKKEIISFDLKLKNEIVKEKTND